MISMVSGLRKPSDRAVEGPPFTSSDSLTSSALEQELDRRLQKAKDSILQDVMQVVNTFNGCE
jgi:hypothetical protein